MCGGRGLKEAIVVLDGGGYEGGKKIDGVGLCTSGVVE